MDEAKIATRGLFVTGTSTDVGKTYVTALLGRAARAAGLGVGAYKPVCTGDQLDQPVSHQRTDVEELAQAIGRPDLSDRVGPQRFQAPLAPPVAAQLENRSVNEQLLIDGLEWWQGRVDVLLVEGVGGLLCPLTDTNTVADFAWQVGFPVLIVASMELGTINHTLLTVEVAQHRGLEVCGIVMNQSHPSQDISAENQNPDQIASRCHVPVLGVIPWKSEPELRCQSSKVTMGWLNLAAERSVRSR